MSDRIDLVDRGRVRVLTFARPEVLNAFDDAQYDAVRHALLAAARDPHVAVVVLTGVGRAFTAGQDLSELARPPRYEDGEPHGFQPFIETVAAFPKPLVAAVNGLAVGIGLTMLPHCDLVLVAKGARLRAPFVQLGVTVEAGNSLLLPDRIGWQNAAHLLYTAEWLESDQAVDTGLAWKEVPSERLLDETLAEAERIARMPIDSLIVTKKLLLAARADALRAAFDRESAVFARLRRGSAVQESLAAFREKREPDFTAIPLTEDPEL